MRAEITYQAVKPARGQQPATTVEAITEFVERSTKAELNAYVQRTIEEIGACQARVRILD